MKINPEVIIDNIKTYAKQHYRDDRENIPRMEYQINSLETQIRQMCAKIEQKDKSIHDLEKLLESK